MNLLQTWPKYFTSRDYIYYITVHIGALGISVLAKLSP